MAKKDKGGAPAGNRNAFGKEIADAIDAVEPVMPERQIESLDGIGADDYRSLALRVPDREAKPADEMRWAVKWVYFHPAEIDPKQVPSRAAVFLLQRAQDDPKAFFEQWTKMLPTRQQIETQERFQDDGRDAIENIKAALAELDGSQGHQEES